MFICYQKKKDKIKYLTQYFNIFIILQHLYLVFLELLYEEE